MLPNKQWELCRYNYAPNECHASYIRFVIKFLALCYKSRRHAEFISASHGTGNRHKDNSACGVLKQVPQFFFNDFVILTKVDLLSAMLCVMCLSLNRCFVPQHDNLFLPLCHPDEGESVKRPTLRDVPIG